jgi:hypothetical protein
MIYSSRTCRGTDATSPDEARRQAQLIAKFDKCASDAAPQHLADAA